MTSDFCSLPRRKMKYRIKQRVFEKPVSFENFWQMIIERRESLVVMLTDLQEGGRKKSDQYWPDRDNEVKEIGSGISIKHVSSSYQGVFIREDWEPLHTESRARQLACVFVTYKNSSETNDRSLRAEYTKRLWSTPLPSKIQGKKLCKCKSSF